MKAVAQSFADEVLATQQCFIMAPLPISKKALKKL
jgi:hypothetical protein